VYLDTDTAQFPVVYAQLDFAVQSTTTQSATTSDRSIGTGGFPQNIRRMLLLLVSLVDDFA
jgi:hypothetical protein